jgi:hypothetical protein
MEKEGGGGGVFIQGNKNGDRLKKRIQHWLKNMAAGKGKYSIRKFH